MAKGSTAVYLYCVVRAARRPSLVARAAPGFPAARARRRTSCRLLSGSSRPRSRWNLWTRSTSSRGCAIWTGCRRPPLAHEAVVEHFSRARGAVVVPMKLFTMFSSMDKAIADVAAGKTAIERAMRHIAGSRGMGRPDHAPSRRGRSRQPASAAPGVGGRVSGRQERRARRDGEGPRGVAGGGGRGLHSPDALRQGRAAAAAAAGAGHQSSDSRSGVPRDRRLARARFKAEAKRQAALCASAGADMTLTGPWPAYNFIGATKESA